jgi:hypothetical protein
MDQAETFLALFLYADESRDPFSVRLPRLGRTPPRMLRAATTFEGAVAVDLYRLADESSWPDAAAFLYAETVPGVVGDGADVEQVPTPDD